MSMSKERTSSAEAHPPIRVAPNKFGQFAFFVAEERLVDPSEAIT